MIMGSGASRIITSREGKNLHPDYMSILVKGNLRALQLWKRANVINLSQDREMAPLKTVSLRAPLRCLLLEDWVPAGQCHPS